jgi:hypothetical protein
MGSSVNSINLSTGTLHIPSDYHADGGMVDVIMHFHGSAEWVLDRFMESKRNAVLVIVSFNGLSGVYAKPFRAQGLFRRILGEALRRTGDHCGLKQVKIRRLMLSSFSAGYGAVREILKVPEYQTVVSDVVLADSLYAGYIEGSKDVEPSDMTSFAQFAELAAEGKRSMWITHSSEFPGSYASTTETADYLIDHVGAERVPSTPGASGAETGFGLNLISSADLKGFHVRGYSGDANEAHGLHLRALGVWWGNVRY